MCCQPLPSPLSSPSAKLMIMALEEYGYQSRRGILEWLLTCVELVIQSKVINSVRRGVTVMRYGLLRMLRRRQPLLTPNFPKVNYSMLERSTGIAGVTKATLGPEIQIDDKLYFIEEPVEIMDQEVKRLKQSRIPIVKVRWNSRRGHEFTWEREDQFQKKYPHLFANPLTFIKYHDLSFGDKSLLTGKDYDTP
ncbi:hypothetical protein Tco_1022621 [Tanacetum coccineum]